MVKLFVEGGGDTNALRTECRRGFREFLCKVDERRSMPRIVACGGRRQAYEAFCTAVKNGEDALLLVDSESAVSSTYQQGQDFHTWRPWAHLQECEADEWSMPQGAHDTDCHLMAQCMEAWFLADRSALHKFYGQGFNEHKLPNSANALETITKAKIFESLIAATLHCKTKARYDKGEHSFKLLACIDPYLVLGKCPWAKRFIEILKERMVS